LRFDPTIQVPGKSAAAPNRNERLSRPRRRNKSSIRRHHFSHSAKTWRNHGRVVSVAMTRRNGTGINRGTAMFTLSSLFLRNNQTIAAALGAFGFALTLGTAPAQSAPLQTLPFSAPQVQQLPQVEDDADSTEMPARFKRQVVTYNGAEATGTIVIDTPNTYLYYVLGGGRAIRYGIGVGREGFTWSGVQAISKKAEWPDWTPPPEMLVRQPYLPRFMAGGPGNPLGARAMYLGGTVYRIHGTNNPSTIGGRVSSGCIRMTNEDVTDLYSRVAVGTKVVVKPTDRRAETLRPRG
jgi:lipoprotein-anchoring transpeptidase ErfK/SrfK